ncbi:hypothetical protein [Trinickia dinghuensis]|uniref:Uncharacterized protein n=1 Tax=Trinickia dinghuensis TaxID=2291023 RepID=A0A3D8K608_9BURK|nr:hypothetical protein [Trinickia dinghuensis]RDV00660.1 hypothetical protein DWV00_02540 [Trinickia dinghuensis]
MSALNFRNQTPYIAQFVAKKGQLVMARLPGIAPQAELSMPSDDAFSVIATTIIDGNTYSTAPATVSGSMEFLAQIKQNVKEGTYEFQMQLEPSPRADQMIFQKTTIGPVTFTILKNGVSLQSVVVPNSFMTQALTIDDNYSVYAVINGITTEAVRTTDPNAVITAVVDTSVLETGYFTLTAA